MNSATDQASKTSRSSGTVIAVVVLVALTIVPLLYFLSVGPVTWLCSRGYIAEADNDSPSARFYYPLVWIAQRSRPAGFILFHYASLWAMDPLPSPPPAAPIPAGPATSAPRNPGPQPLLGATADES